jgi:hypothetical protein
MDIHLRDELGLSLGLFCRFTVIMHGKWVLAIEVMRGGKVV